MRIDASAAANASDVCPVDVPDDFNAGLAQRKAIYLPVPHAIPNPYVIDFAACTRCGACVEICPTEAIQLPEQVREGFRILVVDDELIVRDSLKEWLAEEGFSVDMAASGLEALDQLTKQSYQLMLLDIKMPGMDGVEVLQKARESSPDLKVIMMTAYATVETAVEAMKIGALDYLVKPFDPEAMVPMVLGIYQDLAAAEGRQIEVGAIVLCGGTDFFQPDSGKNTFGYRAHPNVVTSLEFERLLSGTGPSQGRWYDRQMANRFRKSLGFNASVPGIYRPTPIFAPAFVAWLLSRKRCWPRKNHTQIWKQPFFTWKCEHLARDFSATGSRPKIFTVSVLKEHESTRSCMIETAGT